MKRTVNHSALFIYLDSKEGKTPSPISIGLFFFACLLICSTLTVSTLNYIKEDINTSTLLVISFPCLLTAVFMTIAYFQQRTIKAIIDIHLEQCTELEHVFSINPLAILLLNRSGQITALNELAAKILTAKANDNIRQSISREIISFPSTNSIEIILQANERGKCPIVVHSVERKLSGTLHFWPSKLGGADNLTLVIEDNSALHEASNKSVELQHRLHRAQKIEAIGMLADGIAHDFNNILQPILGLSEMGMEDVEPDSPIYKSLARIHRAGTRAKQLVKQILSHGHKSKFKTVELNINESINEALELYHSIIPPRISISRSLSPHLSPILADPIVIQQIIFNILKNAFDAMEGSGGSIVISTINLDVTNVTPLFNTELAPGQYVKLSIEDNGPGIPAKIIEKIFDPFFTTKAVDKGTGLGLSSVLKILQEMGAGVSVRSQPAQGASFSFYFRSCENPNTTKAPSDRGGVIP
ncbi:MAG: ATP-binding protein [bacterium]|nr:ATP-binding protein [bacterium]